MKPIETYLYRLTPIISILLISYVALTAYIRLLPVHLIDFNKPLSLRDYLILLGIAFLHGQVYLNFYLSCTLTSDYQDITSDGETKEC